MSALKFSDISHSGKPSIPSLTKLAMPVALMKAVQEKVGPDQIQQFMDAANQWLRDHYHEFGVMSKDPSMNLGLAYEIFANGFVEDVPEMLEYFQKAREISKQADILSDVESPIEIGKIYTRTNTYPVLYAIPIYIGSAEGVVSDYGSVAHGDGGKGHPRDIPPNTLIVVYKFDNTKDGVYDMYAWREPESFLDNYKPAPKVTTRTADILSVEDAGGIEVGQTYENFITDVPFVATVLYVGQARDADTEYHKSINIDGHTLRILSNLIELEPDETVVIYSITPQDTKVTSSVLFWDFVPNFLNSYSRQKKTADILDTIEDTKGVQVGNTYKSDLGTNTQIYSTVLYVGRADKSPQEFHHLANSWRKILKDLYSDDPEQMVVIYKARNETDSDRPENYVLLWQPLEKFVTQYPFRIILSRGKTADILGEVQPWEEDENGDYVFHEPLPYDKLPDDIKQKVLENYYDLNIDREWWDFDYEYFQEKLTEVGLEAETFYFSLDRADYVQARRLHVNNMERFAHFLADKYSLPTAYALTNTIYDNVHISFSEPRESENQVEYVEVYVDEDLPNVDWDDVQGQFETNADAAIKDILREFHSILEKDYEYNTSEEAIIETIEANDYTFDEEGKIASKSQKGIVKEADILDTVTDNYDMFRLSGDYINFDVSHGTLRTESVIDNFLEFLKTETPSYWGIVVLPKYKEQYDNFQKAVAHDDNVWYNSDEAYEFMENLWKALDAIAPTGTSFSNHEGNSSLFGFWSKEEEGEEHIGSLKFSAQGDHREIEDKDYKELPPNMGLSGSIAIMFGVKKRDGKMYVPAKKYDTLFKLMDSIERDLAEDKKVEKTADILNNLDFDWHNKYVGKTFYLPHSLSTFIVVYAGRVKDIPPDPWLENAIHGEGGRKVAKALPKNAVIVIYHNVNYNQNYWRSEPDFASSLIEKSGLEASLKFADILDSVSPAIELGKRYVKSMTGLEVYPVYVGPAENAPSYLGGSQHGDAQAEMGSIFHIDDYKEIHPDTQVVIYSINSPLNFKESPESVRMRSAWRTLEEFLQMFKLDLQATSSLSPIRVDRTKGELGSDGNYFVTYLVTWPNGDTWKYEVPFDSKGSSEYFQRLYAYKKGEFANFIKEHAVSSEPALRTESILETTSDILEVPAYLPGQTYRINSGVGTIAIIIKKVCPFRTLMDEFNDDYDVIADKWNGGGEWLGIDGYEEQNPTVVLFDANYQKAIKTYWETFEEFDKWINVEGWKLQRQASKFADILETLEGSPQVGEIYVKRNNIKKSEFKVEYVGLVRDMPEDEYLTEARYGRHVHDNPTAGDLHDEDKIVIYQGISAYHDTFFWRTFEDFVDTFVKKEENFEATADILEDIGTGYPIEEGDTYIKNDMGSEFTVIYVGSAGDVPQEEGYLSARYGRKMSAKPEVRSLPPDTEIVIYEHLEEEHEYGGLTYWRPLDEFLENFTKEAIVHTNGLIKFSDILDTANVSTLVYSPQELLKSLRPYQIWLTDFVRRPGYDYEDSERAGRHGYVVTGPQVETEKPRIDWRKTRREYEPHEGVYLIRTPHIVYVVQQGNVLPDANDIQAQLAWEKQEGKNAIYSVEKYEFPMFLVSSDWRADSGKPLPEFPKIDYYDLPQSIASLKFSDEKPENEIFVCIEVPEDARKKFKHIKGLEEDLHMTLFYVGDVDTTPSEQKRILRDIQNISKQFEGLSCEFTGMGTFDNGNDTVVALVNVLEGAKLHSEIEEKVLGVKPDSEENYGYLPHVTLKYDGDGEANLDDLKEVKWTAKKLRVQFTNEEEDTRYYVDLGTGKIDPPFEEKTEEKNASLFNDPHYTSLSVTVPTNDKTLQGIREFFKNTESPIDKPLKFSYITSRGYYGKAFWKQADQGSEEESDSQSGQEAPEKHEETQLVYPTLEDIYEIHSEVLQQWGGSDGKFDSTDAKLEAALGRMQSSWGGQDLYPTLLEKAAILLHSLATTHAFVDGNKRTAYATTLYFLEENGLTFEDSEEFADQVLQMASTPGGGSHENAHEWFKKNTKPHVSEPDEDDIESLSFVSFVKKDSPYGLIDPQGTFYPVSYEGHIGAAEKFLMDRYNYKSNDIEELRKSSGVWDACTELLSKDWIRVADRGYFSLVNWTPKTKDNLIEFISMYMPDQVIFIEQESREGGYDTIFEGTAKKFLETMASQLSRNIRFGDILGEVPEYKYSIGDRVKVLFAENKEGWEETFSLSETADELQQIADEYHYFDPIKFLDNHNTGTITDYSEEEDFPYVIKFDDENVNALLNGIHGVSSFRDDELELLTQPETIASIKFADILEDVTNFKKNDTVRVNFYADEEFWSGLFKHLGIFDSLTELAGSVGQSLFEFLKHTAVGKIWEIFDGPEGTEYGVDFDNLNLAEIIGGETIFYHEDDLELLHSASSAVAVPIRQQLDYPNFRFSDILENVGNPPKFHVGDKVFIDLRPDEWAWDVFAFAADTEEELNYALRIGKDVAKNAYGTIEDITSQMANEKGEVDYTYKINFDGGTSENARRLLNQEGGIWDEEWITPVSSTISSMIAFGDILEAVKPKSEYKKGDFVHVVWTRENWGEFFDWNDSDLSEDDQLRIADDYVELSYGYIKKVFYVKQLEQFFYEIKFTGPPPDMAETLDNTTWEARDLEPLDLPTRRASITFSDILENIEYIYPGAKGHGINTNNPILIADIGTFKELYYRWGTRDILTTDELEDEERRLYDLDRREEVQNLPCVIWKNMDTDSYNMDLRDSVQEWFRPGLPKESSVIKFADILTNLDEYWTDRLKEVENTLPDEPIDETLSDEEIEAEKRAKEVEQDKHWFIGIANVVNQYTTDNGWEDWGDDGVDDGEYYQQTYAKAFQDGVIVVRIAGHENNDSINELTLPEDSDPTDYMTWDWGVDYWTFDYIDMFQDDSITQQMWSEMGSEGQYDPDRFNTMRWASYAMDDIGGGVDYYNNDTYDAWTKLLNVLRERDKDTEQYDERTFRPPQTWPNAPEPPDPDTPDIFTGKTNREMHPEWYRTRQSSLKFADILETIEKNPNDIIPTYHKEGDYDMYLDNGYLGVWLEWIGEGRDGDYMETDPEDARLMRLSVTKNTGTLAEPEWEQIEDTSYCTQIGADLPRQKRKRYLFDLWDEIWSSYWPITESSESELVRLCENLSWMGNINEAIRATQETREAKQQMPNIKFGDILETIAPEPEPPTLDDFANKLKALGFTDGVDVNPSTSLYYYGLLRNPQTNITVFFHPGFRQELNEDVAVVDYNKKLFDHYRITKDEVLEAVNNKEEAFFRFIGMNQAEYIENFVESNHIVPVISDLIAWSDEFPAEYMFSFNDMLGWLEELEARVQANVRPSTIQHVADILGVLEGGIFRIRQPAEDEEQFGPMYVNLTQMTYWFTKEHSKVNKDHPGRIAREEKNMWMYNPDINEVADWTFSEKESKQLERAYQKYIVGGEQAKKKTADILSDVNDKIVDGDELAKIIKPFQVWQEMNANTYLLVVGRSNSVITLPPMGVEKNYGYEVNGTWTTYIPFMPDKETFNRELTQKRSSAIFRSNQQLRLICNNWVTEWGDEAKQRLRSFTRTADILETAISEEPYPNETEVHLIDDQMHWEDILANASTGLSDADVKEWAHTLNGAGGRVFSGVFDDGEQQYLYSFVADNPALEKILDYYGLLNVYSGEFEVDRMPVHTADILDTLEDSEIIQNPWTPLASAYAQMEPGQVWEIKKTDSTHIYMTWKIIGKTPNPETEGWKINIKKPDGERRIVTTPKAHEDLYVARQTVLARMGAFTGYTGPVFAWVAPDGRAYEVQNHDEEAEEFAENFYGKEFARWAGSGYLFLMMKGWMRVSTTAVTYANLTSATKRWLEWYLDYLPNGKSVTIEKWHINPRNYTVSNYETLFSGPVTEARTVALSSLKFAEEGFLGWIDPQGRKYDILSYEMHDDEAYRLILQNPRWKAEYESRKGDPWFLPRDLLLQKGWLRVHNGSIQIKSMEGPTADTVIEYLATLDPTTLVTLEEYSEGMSDVIFQGLPKRALEKFAMKEGISKESNWYEYLSRKPFDISEFYQYVQPGQIWSFQRPGKGQYEGSGVHRFILVKEIDTDNNKVHGVFGYSEEEIMTKDEMATGDPVADGWYNINFVQRQIKPEEQEEELNA